MSNMGYPKDQIAGTYPVHVKEPSGLLKRVEPLITPKQLKSRFLKGIIELMPKSAQYTDVELKDQINLAINEIEAEIKVPVFAEQFKERHPFDQVLYKSFLYTKVTHGPIRSVEDLKVETSSGDKIYRIPAQWIDMGQAHNRQINVIPLLAAYSSVDATMATGVSVGAAYLIITQNFGFIPSYWTIEYTAGLCGDKGAVPVIVNQLIGVQAAINVLSALAATNRYNTVSISQDGISQSHSGPGPNVFQVRINDLMMKKQELIGQIQRMFQQRFYVGTL